MGIFQNNLMGAAAAAAAGGDFYTHQIDNSVRMTAPSSTSADNARLTRTVGTVDSNVHWTLNFWIKRSAIEGNNPVSSARPLNMFTPRSGTSGSVLHEFLFGATGSYGAGDAFAITNTNTGTYILSTNNLFRDTSAWYNIHIQADLDNGTASEKLKIFVNGTEASYNVDNRSSYTSFAGMVAGNWTIGDYYNYGYPIQSYLAQWCFIDGTTYAASDFGETKNGVWIPKDPSGLTFGSEGYLLKFESSSDLGNDSSGNNNDWSSSNLATHDQMLDSPTFNSDSNANFPTINVLDPTVPLAAISEGNLRITEVANNRGGKANFGIPSSGKWYWEVYANNNISQENWAGITGPDTNSSGDGRGGSSNSTTYGINFSQYGGGGLMSIRKYIAGTESGVSGSLGTTTYGVLGISVNKDDNEVKFYHNNTLYITNSIPATQEFFPAGGCGGGTNSTTFQVWNYGQDGTFAGNLTAQGNSDANGYGNFYYSPPSGFLALCSGNLPTADAVDPAQTDDDYPQKLVDATIYTGTGSEKAVAVGWQPNLTWVKERGGANDNKLTDSVRGATKALESNTNTAETTDAQGVKAFTSTGFTLGTDAVYNNNTDTYVAWNWKEGADYGLDIVTYSGTLTGSGVVNISHSLGAIPECLWHMRRTGAGGAIRHKDLTDANYIMSNQDTMSGGSGTGWGTSGEGSKSGNGNMTALGTSSTFTTNYTGLLNENGNTYVTYVWRGIEGFSKFGSYVANGSSTDNAFVYLGFRPAIIITKGTRYGDGYNIHDNATSPFNLADTVLQPNTSSAELSNYNIDMLSNGFKVRDGDGDLGSNGVKYIYMAWAENPFKYATAR